MNGVIDNIDVRAVGKDRWQLLDDFEWYGIVVPKDFQTDFGSIPPFARPFINPVGQLRPGYLVHDWLYNIRGVLKEPVKRNGAVLKTFTRKQCDQELRVIAVTIDYNRLKTDLVYRAVRVGGGRYWDKAKQTKA